jgi:hypothetical protein
MPVTINPIPAMALLAARPGDAEEDVIACFVA